MQQPTRYYITRSGDEPTLRSVRIAQPRVERGRASDPVVANADCKSVDAIEVGADSPGNGASVKERLQEAIRKHAVAN
jgi:DNA-directed RNA polymerase subunit H (RpoH/RPB5)